MNRLLLLLPCLMLACVQSAMKPGPDPAAGLPPDSLVMSAESVEEFDPMMLPEEELVFRPDWQDTGIVSARSEDAGHVSGFQVQLAATPNREEAEDLRLQAMLLFPGEPVEITWDPPNYKVRLGSEENREGADALKRRALRLGYREAWVVRRKVP